MAQKKDNKAAKAFGAKLKKFRERQGLSIYALAAKSGITLQTIMNLEAGDNEPKWATVCRLADALGVSVADFR